MNKFRIFEEGVTNESLEVSLEAILTKQVNLKKYKNPIVLTFSDKIDCNTDRICEGDKVLLFDNKLFLVIVEDSQFKLEDLDYHSSFASKYPLSIFPSNQLKIVK